MEFLIIYLVSFIVVNVFCFFNEDVETYGEFIVFFLLSIVPFFNTVFVVIVFVFILVEKKSIKVKINKFLNSEIKRPFKF